MESDETKADKIDDKDLEELTYGYPKMTEEEMASHLGCSVAAISKHLHGSEEMSGDYHRELTDYGEADRNPAFDQQIEVTGDKLVSHHDNEDYDGHEYVESLGQDTPHDEDAASHQEDDHPEKIKNIHHDISKLVF